ncbi:MAG: response regulator transcription factor [Bacteroidota bacterium]
MIRVLMFEDNKNFRESLSMYLADSDEIYMVGAYNDPSDALKLIKKYEPDVVLMDIQMPNQSGLEALVVVKSKFPQVRVLMQTVFDDDDKVFAAICGGASGYILKNPKPESYVQAIKDVYAGGSHLSPSISAKVLNMFTLQFANKETYVELTKREKEILQKMVEGHSYKMIADDLFVSVTTICTHIRHIYEKLHVNSAPEAVVKALRLRLV